MRSITIKELAKLAGVSHTLVSGVLRGSEHCRVSQETKEKILKLACEKQYSPNRLAQKLRGGDAKTIFLLSRIHPAPGHSEVIHVIENYFSQKGYQLFQAQTNSSEHTENLLKEFTGLGCSGIVACYTHFVPDESVTVPKVIISDYDDLPHDVGIDREAGARMLTEHLLSHGKQRISFIGAGNWGVQEVYLGYQKALNANGINIPEHFCIDLLYNQKALEQIRNLIEKDKADAFLCTNDFIAGKLIAILQKWGFSVPNQIAVSGMDAQSFAEFTSVPLTSVIFPFKEVGQYAAELLDTRMQGKMPAAGTRSPHKIQPHIYFASSCGCKKNNLDTFYLTPPEYFLKSQDNA